MKHRIYLGDNIDILPKLPERYFRLIYIDPPFNTGRQQKRKRLRTVRDENGDRTGFQGKRFRSEVLSEHFFEDEFDDYLAFLRPRLEQAKRVLTNDGSLFFHIDFREVHYCKVLLDSIFGRESFVNEIIWAYDYGARSKTRWSAKHDNILWYAKNPKNYIFNFEAIDRIPYMAPKLVTPEKAARGKTPTDVWWLTIVSPTGKEKTGYPTQKPLKLLERIIAVHSNKGDHILDFFAGTGTTGVAADNLGRYFTLIDNSPIAANVMRKRFGLFAPEVITCATK
ncbi:MAG: DNA methyltransferase [Anaerolineaceae bacterium]|nr:DNA methyltransferase [Anaerolineaceae bacterium]MDE0330054.1 DNA methyltransferase [Anaerolineaceae bacterium]